ncbi:uncharacterized protein RJT20DRAFT_126890 [Scheffersomyces xylosifermentans]|uniref:uncharacterized protein n=1 Tax=Scheffersomyces xylosifermentans TaxID=1304137 RepID=UPI00315DAB2D
MVTNITSIVNNNSTHSSPSLNKKQEIIDNLIKLAKEEQQRGNKSVTQDKISQLTSYLNKQQSIESNRKGDSDSKYSYSKFKKLPEVPKPKFSPLFNKFDLSKSVASVNSTDINSGVEKGRRKQVYRGSSKFSLKRLESIVVEILESLANLLDSLHLLSNLPMFPKVLSNLLKHTNKLWVIILVFLIRKTISQLYNVIRKERKVKVELEILNFKNGKGSQFINEDINKKYKKILKDLKFDKMMLYIELFGNFLDFTFNFIELYGIPVPDWFMSTLNVSSMAMTVYRMNKDDEYVDDDITEDLI